MTGEKIKVSAIPRRSFFMNILIFLVDEIMTVNTLGNLKCDAASLAGGHLK